MSDQLKHECGVSMMRLNQPLQYYIDKYQTPSYGLDKMYIMMEKMRNRGQDGAGLAVVKKNIPYGEDFIYRVRSAKQNCLTKVFKEAYETYDGIPKDKLQDENYLLNHAKAFGNVYLGHLRYGTHGVISEEVCHPFYRKSNWITRNLVLAGNFNLTNVDALLKNLIQLGQHPRQKADTVLVLEKIGHFLDYQVQKLFNEYKSEGFTNLEITEKIKKNLSIEDILEHSVRGFDGGYTIAGVLGYGDAFVFRDPNGIRPCYYYTDDEITVTASERPAIATAFNIDFNKIKELPPAHALIMRGVEPPTVVKIQPELERRSCSFERIYFARGTDGDIYKERKQLGKLLAPIVFEKIHGNFKDTVFSFIPNTSEIAYMGLIKGMEKIYRESITSSLTPNDTQDKTKDLIEGRIREEKLIVKDVKLRTFITDDTSRNNLVSHVYDITYNSINPHKDTLCILDDSIVRGTTLKESIISILARLHPKKIMVISSAPPIKYPDCYGIDMSRLGDLLIFRAAIHKLTADGKLDFIQEIYNKCKAENQKPVHEIQNIVKEFYAYFTDEDLIKIASKLVTPDFVDFEVELVFQTLENLHIACPNDTGDWYFSGNYATPGGNKVANQAFINYVEHKTERAY